MLLLRLWWWQATLDWKILILTESTCLIYLYDLEHDLEIHTFLGLLDLVWSLRFLQPFLEPSGYCTVINCPFNFHTTNVFHCFFNVLAQFELVTHKFEIRLHYTFICTAYNHNGTFHSLNCFGHVIYVLQTSTALLDAKLTWYLQSATWQICIFY